MKRLLVTALLVVAACGGGTSTSVPAPGDAALAKLKTVLEKDPKDTNALYLIGVSYLRKQMWAEAVPGTWGSSEMMARASPSAVLPVSGRLRNRQASTSSRVAKATMAS